MVWLGASGAPTFADDGAGHALLLATTGVVTALPLICFGGAATRVPLTTLGLLQYVTPMMQFVHRGVLLRRADADGRAGSASR